MGWVDVGCCGTSLLDGAKSHRRIVVVVAAVVAVAAVASPVWSGWVG